MTNISNRKKYFSSVERLRIAQQSAVQKRTQQSTQPACPSTRLSMDSSPRTRSAHSRQNSPTQLTQPSRAVIVRSDADVTEEQAILFMNLPDKVKRSQFTPKELTLLTESSQRVLGLNNFRSSCSQDSPQRQPFGRRQSLGHPGDRSSLTYDPAFVERSRDWPLVDAQSVRSVASGNTLVDIFKLYSRRRPSSASTVESSRPPTAPSRIMPRQPPPPFKSFSQSRSKSLMPLPLPPPTLSPVLPRPSLPILESKLSPVYSVASEVAVETPPTTKYYKDTTARLQLREYVSSPEKFDEAIEFGFPSDRGGPGSSPVSPGFGSAYTLGRNHLPFATSKDDEDEDDRASLSSLRTPSLIHDGEATWDSNVQSLDSSEIMPFPLGLVPPRTSVRSLSPELAGREMTIRMTLTRPELRAPEAELYAFQRKQVSGVDLEIVDPLALDPLPVCEDHSGAHGAFAIPSVSPRAGAFMKRWKTFRRV